MALKLFGGRLVIGKMLPASIGNTDGLWSIMSQRFGIDYKTQHRLKAYRNVVYGCTSLIGEALGDYRPYLEQRRGEKWVRVDHEFFNLLNQPGGRFDTADPPANSFSSFNLWEATGTYQLLQGDAFWYMGLGEQTKKPRQITILRADRVGTDVDPKTGKVNGYFVRREGKDPIPLEVNEVLRFPLFNPETPLKGKGVVEATADYIEIDESTAAFTKNFFKNGAAIAGVLNVKGEVTKNAFRKFVRAWREKYEGTENAGKVAVLRDSDAAFTKVGLGLNELDMSNLRKMSLDDVFMSFKVPPALLGKLTDGSGLGRGNIETLEYIFSKWNIDKKMTRFDSILMFALQRYYGLDSETYRVCHENIIPADKDYELQVRDKGIDRWLTRDEIRAKDQLEAVPGGDKLRAPLTSVPIDMDVTPASSTSSAGKTAGPITVKIKRKVKKDEVQITQEQAERFRLSLERTALRYVKLYSKKVKPILEDQRREALTNLEAHASSLKKDASQPLFDSASYNQRMTDDLQPVLTDLAEVQGGLAMSFGGDEEAEFKINEKMRATLKRSTMRMATNYNSETLERLNTALATGIQEGEGIAALKSRLGDVFDDAESYRLERIARTETIKASNASAVEAYRQLGFVTAKQWVVNPDACEQCAEFDGKTVPLDDAFLGQGESYSYTDENGDEQTVENSYDTVEEPPLHPNCRCVVVPLTDLGKSVADSAAKLKAQNSKILSARLEDKIYIRKLEKHLGIEDDQE